MKIRDFRRRAITSLFLAAIVIGLIALSATSAGLLVLLIVMLAGFEMWKMSFPGTDNHEALLFGLICTIPGTLSFLHLELPSFELPENIGFFVLPLVPVVLLLSGLRKPVDTITRRLLVASAGTVLFSLSGVFGTMLAHDLGIGLLCIFFLIWASDTFAYLVGSAIGRNKLVPSISPGKTWEGFAGGAAFTFLVSFAIPYVFPELINYPWGAIALIVVIFGTLGDISQSAFKRSAKVKDSGTILPGHGGVWDRFDSFLGCIPWVGLYLILFNS